MYIYVYMYICIYVYMYICIYVYMYLRRLYYRLIVQAFMLCCYACSSLLQLVMTAHEP